MQQFLKGIEIWGYEGSKHCSGFTPWHLRKKVKIPGRDPSVDVEQNGGGGGDGDLWVFLSSRS